MRTLTDSQQDAERRERLGKSWEHQELSSAFEAMGAKRKTLDVPCPLVLAEGTGAYVTDLDGNKYLDMIMGFGPHLLGHRPPVVEGALKRQIALGWHFGLTNETQAVLAERLVDAYGGHGKILFSGAGSDAVMYALRLARADTGRNKIALFDGSYHGNIDYVLMGVDASSPVSAPTSSVIGGGVPSGIIDDTMLMLPYRDDAAFEQIEKHAADIAGVLVQTVQNSLPRLDNGPFLSRLRELCDAHGILLIFDEVVTGFRIAYGGGREFFGVEPDLAAFGKSLGGGLPIGAIWGRSEIMSLLPRDNSDGGVFSSGTFNANPLTMATGLAMLQYLGQNREAIYARLQKMGERLAHGVNTYANARQMRATLMHAGSMLCLHFECGELNSSRDIKSNSAAAKSAFFLAMMDRGVLMPAGRMTLLSDAHKDSDIDKLVEAITESLGLLRDRGHV